STWRRADEWRRRAARRPPRPRRAGAGGGASRVIRPAESAAADSCSRWGRPAQRSAERNVVLGRRAGLVAGRLGGRRGRGGHSRCARLRTAEHQYAQCLDLGRLTLVSLAIVPLAGLDRALDVDLLPLAQVLAHDLRLLAPDHDAVPLGALLT